MKPYYIVKNQYHINYVFELMQKEKINNNRIVFLKSFISEIKWHIIKWLLGLEVIH
jgi:hypothetical protein